MCQHKSPRERQPKGGRGGSGGRCGRGGRGGRGGHGGDVAPMSCSVVMKLSTATTRPMSGGTG